MADPLAIAYQPAVGDTFPPIPKSYIEEHYITHVFKDCRNTPGNDIAVLAHPNGITLITLAPSHSFLREDPPTNECATASSNDLRLTFDLGGKSLLDAEFRKGRGPLIHPGQAICKLILGQPGQASNAPEDQDNGQVTEPVARVDENQGDEIEIVIVSPVRGALMEANNRLLNLDEKTLRAALRDDYIMIVELKPFELEKLKQEVKT